MIFAAAQKTVTHDGPFTFRFPLLIIPPTKHSYPHMFGYETLNPTYRVYYRYIGNIGIIGGPRKTYSHQQKHGIGRDKTHAQAGQDSRASGTRLTRKRDKTHAQAGQDSRASGTRLTRKRDKSGPCCGKLQQGLRGGIEF